MRLSPPDPACRFAHAGFCNGPWFVNPSFRFASSLPPGLASVRGRREGRHLMGFEEDRSANLRERGLMPRPAWRPDLIHRPGVGTSLRGGWCHDPPESPSMVSPSLGPIPL